MTVIVMGNPFDGLTIHGPFEDFDAANDWVEEQGLDDDWWAVELVKP